MAERGGFYPHALATYLKNTPLLHWVVKSPEQIQKLNFLIGEAAHSYTNLEKFDGMCVYACTGDGKADWLYVCLFSRGDARDRCCASEEIRVRWKWKESGVEVIGSVLLPLTHHTHTH